MESRENYRTEGNKMGPRRQKVPESREDTSSSSENLESLNVRDNNQVALQGSLRFRRSHRQTDTKAKKGHKPRPHARQFTSTLKKQVERFIDNLRGQGQREAKSLYGEVGSSVWKTALLTYLNDVLGNNVTLNELTFWMRYYPESFKAKEKRSSSSETSTDLESGKTRSPPKGMAHIKSKQEPRSRSDTKLGSGQIETPWSEERKTGQNAHPINNEGEWNPPNQTKEMPSYAKYAVQRPNYGMSQPEYAIQRPNYGMSQPQYAIQRPNYGIQQPNYGIQQPNYGILQPIGGFNSFRPATQSQSTVFFHMNSEGSMNFMMSSSTIRVPPPLVHQIPPQQPPSS